MTGTPHDVAQKAIIDGWEGTASEARLTWDELQGAANIAIKALRDLGYEVPQ